MRGPEGEVRQRREGISEFGIPAAGRERKRGDLEMRKK